MTYLLIATLVFYGLTWWAYKAGDKLGDDFGVEIYSLFSGGVAVILAVTYVALAFWNHRFL